jgi:cobalt-zinc-cadmium resistance protein CzcA
VIGGLLTSTLLTLFVLPAAYRWFAPPLTTPE